VCWWSVNDDDDLPCHTRRPVVDTQTPSAAAAVVTSSDTSTCPASAVQRDCEAAAAAAAAAVTDADFTQLNNVVRQSDVLKSVTPYDSRNYSLLKYFTRKVCGVYCMASTEYDNGYR